MDKTWIHASLTAGISAMLYGCGGGSDTTPTPEPYPDCTYQENCPVQTIATPQPVQHESK